MKARIKAAERFIIAVLRQPKLDQPRAQLQLAASSLVQQYPAHFGTGSARLLWRPRIPSIDIGAGLEALLDMLLADHFAIGAATGRAFLV